MQEEMGTDTLTKACWILPHSHTWANSTNMHQLEAPQMCKTSGEFNFQLQVSRRQISSFNGSFIKPCWLGEMPVPWFLCDWMVWTCQLTLMH